MLRYKLFVITAIILFAGNVHAQITGSAHDFSGETWTSEICNVCHTPHNSNTTVSGAPLWNHELTAETFTLYNSHTLTATLAQPDGASKLCLSCHDGVVAVDNFGGTTTGTVLITGSAKIGADLSDDHPVSFTYDDALATSDGTLYAPSTANSGLGSTIAADLLRNGKLECSSCHDAHNTDGFSDMLVKANTSSALCLTCHNK